MNAPPTFLLLHKQQQLGLVSTKPRINPGNSQNPSLLIRSYAVGWRASTETEISMA